MRLEHGVRLRQPGPRVRRTGQRRCRSIPRNWSAWASVSVALRGRLGTARARRWPCRGARCAPRAGAIALPRKLASADERVGRSDRVARRQRRACADAPPLAETARRPVDERLPRRGIPRTARQLARGSRSVGDVVHAPGCRARTTPVRLDSALAVDAPAERGPVRLAAQARALVVRRRVDLRLAFEQRAELCRPGVQLPQVGGRDVPVQRVAEQLVPEVVVALSTQPNVNRNPLSTSSSSASSRSFTGRSMHAGEHLGHEAAPDDGAGPRHGAGVVRQPREAGEDRVLDRLGDLGLADRRAVAAIRPRRWRPAAPRCGAGSHRSAGRPRRRPRAAPAARSP